MKKDPAFLFYSSDFITGVIDMTMEERGQYITMMCLQHQKGHLSEKTICFCVGSVSDLVLSKFKQDESGCYYNERVEEEIVKRARYTASRAANGLKGGRKKSSENESTCKAYAKAYENHTEDENDNENKDINRSKNGDKKSEDFDAFWKAYPKKKGKVDAKKAFAKVRVPVDILIAAVKTQAQSEQWIKENGQYIPFPAKWLNQGRWEDEPTEAKESQGFVYDYGDCEGSL